MSKKRRYCLTRAFFGSVMIWTRALTSSGMSGLMTGSRPMNSGIMPNSSRSSEVTLPSSSPRSVCCSAWVWLPKPIVLRPTRRAMMFSRPTNVPPQMNRMLVVSIWMYCCSGCLRPPCGGHVGHGPLEHLQEGLLDSLAGDVARDRDVVRGLADLVDFVDVDNAALGGFEIEVGGVQQLEQDVLDVLAHVAGLGERGRVADGEGNVQDPSQRPRQQRLAAAGRPDQEDVRLVELDFGLGVFAVNQPLVVVVHGHRQDFFGPFLADHVGVELLLDLARRRDVGEERLGNAAPFPLLVEDLLAELDAIAADVDVARTFHQRADVAIALAAEGAIGVFLGAARGSRAHVATAISFSPVPPSHRP